jgi:hypothetical protein
MDNLNALAPDFPTESKTYPNSPHHGGRAWERRDEFEINDEGWLVWVGKGNHYTEGFEKSLWGTTTTIAGITYEWGIPMWWLTDAGAPRREQFGENNAHNFGWGNSLRLGPQFNAYMQWMATVGHIIVDRYYNSTGIVNPRYDQGGKPDELKKPTRAHFGKDGPGGHYDKEQADLLKMQSVTLNYQFRADQLSRVGLGVLGMQNLSVGLTGRDLITITNCLCPNAESGLRYEDDTEGTGSARNFGTGRSYPPGRTVSLEVSITF